MTDPSLTAASLTAASAPLPMPGARITSPSGWRDRGGGRREWHEGADLRAAVGTPVLAVRAGIVHDALPQDAPGFHGYGNIVVLWHPQDGVYTAYAHLSETLVVRGDAVVAGTVIAASGVTSGGRHLGMCPHLHFAVRRPRADGRAPWPGAYPHPERASAAHRTYWVDPVDYLRGFGLEPATQSGAGELRIRPASAADAGGGRPYPPRCPQSSPVVLAGARIDVPGGAPPERPLVLEPSPAEPPSGGPSDGAPNSAPSSSPSSAAPPPSYAGASCWPWVVLAGGLGLGAAALTTPKKRPRR